MTLPYVTVNLGGKERSLHYTMRSMKEIERRLGLKNVFAEIQAIPLGAGNLLTFLWAGLVVEGPRPTEDEIGDWIDGTNFELVSAAFAEAFAEFFPSPDGKEAATENHPLAPSAGEQSKRLPMDPSPSSPASSGKPA